LEADPVPLHERRAQRGFDTLDLFIERRLRHLYFLEVVRALGYRNRL
jgi:predicted amidophosphoribosyltransferase